MATTRAATEGLDGPDVSPEDSDDVATDAAEVPAVAGGDGVEDVGALQPQNRIREASKTPQPIRRLHTCRNEWLGAWLRYIGPPRLNRRADEASGNQRPFIGKGFWRIPPANQ